MPRPPIYPQARNQGMLPGGPMSQPTLPTDLAYLDKSQSWSAGQANSVSAVVYGATITLDFGIANNFSVTLTGGATLANPSNVVAGMSGTLAVTQDIVGSHVLAYGVNWHPIGGIATPLSTAAGTIDLINWYAVTSTHISFMVLLNA